jgi:nicotinate-nucleotide--dimethylbenzimidazole phosphoribosyltransferase
MNLFEAISKRRDTRHFLEDPIPEEVIGVCLDSASHAPSVGLTRPARFIFVRDKESRSKVYDLFMEANERATELLHADPEREKLYSSLKLEGIRESPLGMVVCVDYSVLRDFTIGTIYSAETLDWSVCCAIQNFWLALTAQGYSMGWVSILNFAEIKKMLTIPDEYKILGYFCIGKPATDYDSMPMLKQRGWVQEE